MAAGGPCTRAIFPHPLARRVMTVEPSCILQTAPQHLSISAPCLSVGHPGPTPRSRTVGKPDARGKCHGSVLRMKFIVLRSKTRQGVGIRASSGGHGRF